MAAPTRRERDRRGWDDASLVEATRAGDQAAWAALYARHLDYTRSVAAKRTANGATAEDAVALGWAKAFERLDALRDPARFRPWVAAAVGHAAVDELRQSRRVVPSGDLTPSQDPTALAAEDDPVADVGVAAADRPSRATVARRAFLMLPERHRKVLGMALVDDMPLAQIATALDLEPNAVSQLLHRAKNGLRRSYVRAHLPESTPEPCRRAHELTIDYARGNEWVKPEVMAHLAACDFCAVRLTEAVSDRRGMWTLFGAVPLVLVALRSLSRRALTTFDTAFHTAFGSGADGVTSLPVPAVGAVAGGSVAVVAAAVTFGTGAVPLPGAQPLSTPPAVSAGPLPSAPGQARGTGIPGYGVPPGGASGGYTGGASGGYAGGASGVPGGGGSGAPLSARPPGALPSVTTGSTATSTPPLDKAVTGLTTTSTSAGPPVTPAAGSSHPTTMPSSTSTVPSTVSSTSAPPTSRPPSASSTTAPQAKPPSSTESRSVGSPSTTASQPAESPSSTQPPATQPSPSTQPPPTEPPSTQPPNTAASPTTARPVTTTAAPATSSTTRPRATATLTTASKYSTTRPSSAGPPPPCRYGWFHHRWVCE